MRRLTLVALLLASACKSSPRHAPPAAPGHPAADLPPPRIPPDAAANPAADPGQPLVVDPALAPQLTHKVSVPGTPWFALTPATWRCQSQGVGQLVCEAAPRSSTRVEWQVQPALGNGTIGERVAELLAQPGLPVREHRRVHSAGALGTLMRTSCTKAQCFDPVLTLWEGDPVMQLEASGDCDRTDCDVALTLAVISSTQR